MTNNVDICRTVQFVFHLFPDYSIDGGDYMKKTDYVIEKMLLQLGVNKSYVGFNYTVQAVNLVLEDESKITLISKWLYPDIAKTNSTSIECVERNIRTIVNTIWYKGNKELLQSYSLTNLTEKPNNTQFISILASYVKNSSL